jgi:hypothetical protein
MTTEESARHYRSDRRHEVDCFNALTKSDRRGIKSFEKVSADHPSRSVPYPVRTSLNETKLQRESQRRWVDTQDEVGPRYSRTKRAKELEERANNQPQRAIDWLVTELKISRQRERSDREQAENASRRFGTTKRYGNNFDRGTATVPNE